MSPRFCLRAWVAGFVMMAGCGSAAVSHSNTDATKPAATAPPVLTPPSGTTANPNAASDANLIIDAPNNTWTWVPVAGTECGNGSATGLGINPYAGSKRVVIFLEGGGRCDSAATCMNNGNDTAANLNGFTAADFNKTIGGQTALFNRNDATNPVAHDNFIFIPYCTGDDHSGDNVPSYGTHHRGYANMGLYLQRVVPTFTNVSQVLLTGSSAGGSGAFWNYYRTQQAFGSIEVVLVDDAGPFIGNPVDEITPTSVTSWGLATTVPAGCDNCLPGADPAGLQNFYPFFAKAMPNHRGSLVTSNEDAHVSARDKLTGAQFATALTTLATNLKAADPNFKVFYVPSNRHTWLGGVNDTLSQVVVGKTNLSAFITDELNDSPDWADVQ